MGAAEVAGLGPPLPLPNVVSPQGGSRLASIQHILEGLPQDTLSSKVTLPEPQVAGGPRSPDVEVPVVVQQK